MHRATLGGKRVTLACHYIQYIYTAERSLVSLSKQEVCMEVLIFFFFLNPLFSMTPEKWEAVTHKSTRNCIVFDCGARSQVSSFMCATGERTRSERERGGGDWPSGDPHTGDCAWAHIKLRMMRTPPPIYYRFLCVCPTISDGPSPI